MERLTDAQWALVEPHLPKHTPSPKGGRPHADDRACFEGVLWILRTDARWKDLPKDYPSPATCWRRLAEWERKGVWLDLWRAFIAQLDHKGQLDWSEAFMDGTFAPAKKGGLASATPAEHTLAVATLEGRVTERLPERIIADRGYDARYLWEAMKARGVDFIAPHLRTRTNRYQDGRKLRRYRRRWIVERTNAWLFNFRRLIVRWENKLEVFRGIRTRACATTSKPIRAAAQRSAAARGPRRPRARRL